MKNSLYIDLVGHTMNSLRINNGFSTSAGGNLDKEQKEKFKSKICEFIDNL